MLWSDKDGAGVDCDHDDAKCEAEGSTKHCGECSITTGEDPHKANVAAWKKDRAAYGKAPKGPYTKIPSGRAGSMD